MKKTSEGNGSGRERVIESIHVATKTYVHIL